MDKDEYKGFCLFNDITDDELRTSNRAKVLANLAEDHTKDRRINTKGAALILGYFGAIPNEERKAVKDKFVNDMQQRGFALVG